MTGKLKSALVSVTWISLLAACSLAPKYNRPEITVPQSYKEEPGNWTSASAKAAPASSGEWWKTYGDDDLNKLEDKITSSNQNIKAALARYEEARADAAQARAGFFPTITSNANVLRERASTTTANAKSNPIYNDGLAGADFSYELDVWGRVRNTANAEKKLQQSSAADLAAMDLSQHSELAMDYFALRGDDETQRVVDETVKSYKKALDLTRARYKGGAGSEADVDQAETQLENAKTLAEDTSLKRSQLLHAIAVLVGESPSEFNIPVKESNIIIPPVAPGLPSKLLEQRPDISSAILKVQAANAEIGVARAAYLPDFTFSAEGGFESALASKFFNAPSLFWSIGPTAMFTVFDGGKIRALNDKALASYDESVANYRQAVLTAFQQVEDNLAAMRQLSKESLTQSAAVTASHRNLSQAKDRYTGGIATYLDIVVAQNTVLQAELNYIDLHTRHLTASVLLVEALGGDWSEAQLNSEPKEETKSSHQSNNK